MVLESLRLRVLSDFNIHAKVSQDGAAQDFVASMTTKDLFQVLVLPHSPG